MNSYEKDLDSLMWVLFLVGTGVGLVLTATVYFIGLQ